jgi:alanine racemase
VPFGYADGYPRRLFEAGADVLIHGRRFPLAGTVTMDQLVIDCGDEPVQVGDEVVLLGCQGDDTITADEWASRAGTISWEILCGIGARVPRVVVDEWSRGASASRPAGRVELSGDPPTGRCRVGTTRRPRGARR